MPPSVSSKTRTTISPQSVKHSPSKASRYFRLARMPGAAPSFAGCENLWAGSTRLEPARSASSTTRAMALRKGYQQQLPIPVDTKEPGTVAFWDERLNLDDILKLL